MLDNQVQEALAGMRRAFDTLDRALATLEAAPPPEAAPALLGAVDELLGALDAELSEPDTAKSSELEAIEAAQKLTSLRWSAAIALINQAEDRGDDALADRAVELANREHRIERRLRKQASEIQERKFRQLLADSE